MSPRVTTTTVVRIALGKVRPGSISSPPHEVEENGGGILGGRREIVNPSEAAIPSGRIVALLVDSCHADVLDVDEDPV
jgi:hypothetical protein